jgi:hypothetical protein
MPKIKKYKRDPHLPSPEVCDWLLSQDWGKAYSSVYVAERQSAIGWLLPPAEKTISTSNIDNCHCITAAIGRDGMINLLLTADELALLREDKENRDATEDL